MSRKHLKSFQDNHYKIADQRVQRCGVVAMLAFKGFYFTLPREFKRLKLI